VKIKVRVDNQDFEVEVGDLGASPVIAVVEGERFEVWPEELNPSVAPVAPVAAPRAAAPVPVWKPRQTDVRPGKATPSFTDSTWPPWRP